MKIYTDGSCYPNPGPAGIGVKWKKNIHVAIGEATNNTAELCAILLAAGLAAYQDTIVTDSRVCISWLKSRKLKNNCQVPAILNITRELINNKYITIEYIKGIDNPAHDIALYSIK